MEKLLNIQNWPQTFPNMPIYKYLKIGIFFTLRKKKNSKRKTKKNSVFEIEKWSQTLLDMPIRGEIPIERPKLQNRMKII